MRKSIDKIKENKVVGSHTAFLAGELLTFPMFYKKYASSDSTLTGEEIRWGIVPIVSVFESFYREIFAKYIDHGAPYVDRVVGFPMEKRSITPQDLVGVAKKSFTIGDIFSYSLKYNSLKEIRETYETLCQCDYVEKIRSFNFPNPDKESEELERAKSSINVIFKKLGFLFELRHTLVHEFPANSVTIGLDELYDYYDCGWLLLMITDRMFWVETGQKDPYRSILPQS